MKNNFLTFSYILLAANTYAETNFAPETSLSKTEKKMNKKENSTKDLLQRLSENKEKIVIASLLLLGVFGLSYKISSNAENHYLGSHEHHKVDFTQDKEIDFTSSKVPIIRKVGWASLEYQKLFQGKIEIFRKKEQPNDKSTAGDEIFWNTGTEHWAWDVHDMHHKPGYTKDMIVYLLGKSPDKLPTHLILSTGWDDVVEVEKERRGSIDKGSLEKILQDKLGNDKKIRILQEFKSRNDLKRKNNNEIVVLVFNTRDAVMAYNLLIQGDKNIVIASIHTTC